MLLQIVAKILSSKCRRQSWVNYAIFCIKRYWQLNFKHVEGFICLYRPCHLYSRHLFYYRVLRLRSLCFWTKSNFIILVLHHLLLALAVKPTRPYTLQNMHQWTLKDPFGPLISSVGYGSLHSPLSPSRDWFQKLRNLIEALILVLS